MAKHRYVINQELIDRYTLRADPVATSILSYETYERSREYIRKARENMTSLGLSDREEIAGKVALRKLVALKARGFDNTRGHGETIDKKYTGWVNANTKNACIDWWRRNAGAEPLEQREDGDRDFPRVESIALARLLTQLNSADTLIITHETLILLDKCLAKLPQDQEALIRTKYLLEALDERAGKKSGEMTTQEAADFLGVSYASANNWDSRARVSLRKCLWAGGLSKGDIPDSCQASLPIAKRVTRNPKEAKKAWDARAEEVLGGLRGWNPVKKKDKKSTPVVSKAKDRGAARRRQ